MKAELAERGHDVDMLLWDLAGEWYGVYANPEGTGYSTRLPDLISNGLDRKIGSRGRFVAFGTSEHFDLWQQGLTRWTHLLRKLGLADRVVLISPTWAPLPDDGVGLDSSELSQTDFRRLAARYARAASDSLPELRIIGRGGRSLPAMADQWRPLSATTAASSLLGIAAEIFDLVFDPTESFPLPRPSVSVLGLTAEISTRVSWGKSFALNISQGDRIVVKGKYQKEPVFSVAVPEPGKYRLRLFHRAGDHKAVVTTATEFAN
jgi:hypothetical protein